jgi:hypothetical protein
MLFTTEKMRGQEENEGKSEPFAKMVKMVLIKRQGEI